MADNVPGLELPQWWHLFTEIYNVSVFPVYQSSGNNCAWADFVGVFSFCIYMCWAGSAFYGVYLNSS